MAANQTLQAKATSAAPLDYPIPSAVEMMLVMLKASFDGSGAGASFEPTVQILLANGVEAGSFKLGTTLAAGASADATWFPGVKASAAASGTGIQYNTDPQTGTYLRVDTTGTDPAADLPAYDQNVYGIVSHNANGMLLASYTAGDNIPLTIEQIFTSTTNQPEALIVNVENIVANDAGTLAVDVTASSTKGESIAVEAGASSDGGVSIGVSGRGAAKAGGTAYGGQFQGHSTTGTTAASTALQAQVVYDGGGAAPTGAQKTFQCLDHTGAAILEVRDDGTYHIKAGTDWVADL